MRKLTDPPLGGIVIDNETRSLMLAEAGSDINASFGAVSGEVVVVTHGKAGEVVHPPGRAGAVTRSKFCPHGPAGGSGAGVGVGVGVFVDVAVAVLVCVAVGVGTKAIPAAISRIVRPEPIVPCDVAAAVVRLRV